MSTPISQGVFPQRDFSAGQIDTDGERRDDLEFVLSAMRVGRNLQIGPSGNAKRRPGSWYVDQIGGFTAQFAPFADVLFNCSFTAGAFKATNVVTGAVQTITGCPWNAAQALQMEVEQVDNTIVVAHQKWRPRVLIYSRGTGLWSISNFRFREDPNGTLRQPFYRFGSEGVTMLPSSRSGSIIITFSADVLETGHVGSVFTYAGKQIRITGVSSPRVANATVLETLPKTHVAVIEGGTGSYEVGEIVEGTLSGISGVIARISGGALYVVAHVQDGVYFEGGEYIVGPRGRGWVNGDQSTGGMQPVFIWEEQFFSNLRGWPGGVKHAYGRLAFYRCDQERRAWLLSSPGVPEDFKVTGEPDGAIFELAPRGSEVRHIASGGDLFLLLNNSVQSVPVSAATPLVPGSVEYRYVGEVGANTVPPTLTNQGLVYISSDDRRVMAIVPTGSQAQPYRLDHISRFHNHLINGPVSLASSFGTVNSPGDYIYIVNSGGDIAVGRYDSGRNWVGFVPWDFDDAEAQFVSAREEDILIGLSKTIEGVDVDLVWRLSDEIYLDGAVRASDARGDVYLTTEDGDRLTTENGDRLLVGATAFAPYTNAAIAVQDGPQYLGGFEVNDDGLILDMPTGYQDAYFGFPFVPVFRPIIPNFNGGQSQKQRLRRRKIAQAVITVRGTTGFKIGNRLIAHYLAGENQELPPPERDMTYRTRPMGRSWDPTIEVRQDVPGPFNIIEFSTESTA